MRVLPLVPQQPSVLSDALVQRGWDPGRADTAARGLESVSFLIDGIAADTRERVANASRTVGVECLTGDGWALLAGGLSRVASLTRPGHTLLPNAIAEPLGSQLRGFAERPTMWRTAGGVLALDRPVVAGILNVTPDSFSDGGQFLKTDNALRHAETMLHAGAMVIDVGAESTRPGRPAPVPPAVEWERLEPVLSALVRQFPEVAVSVDTVKAEIAKQALEHGAWIINDVSSFRLDTQMASVCAAGNAGVVLMHSRGTARDMATYDHADYQDVTSEVCQELRSQVDYARHAGVLPDAVVVDPGLGFSKRPDDNYTMLRRLSTLESLGCPVMVGPSRKRFVREIVDNGEDLADELTAAVCVSAYHRGARLFRVHDVKKTASALAVAHAIGI